MTPEEQLSAGEQIPEELPPGELHPDDLQQHLRTVQELLASMHDADTEDGASESGATTTRPLSEENARPRKMKKPPESVRAVISTELPTAGSAPRRWRSMGMMTPALAARSRLSVIAAVMTKPSEALS
ncbi:hypothetical protein FACS1894116_14840 [Betaproteobacteria bacterium]|nr:hypothetical protein FACS1894116_14840 [Betaproteobacteria bacterium]